LTSKVTETGATALTIEAQIANEEAQIAIDEANAIINDYSFWLEQIDAIIEETDFYFSFSFDEGEKAMYGQ